VLTTRHVAERYRQRTGSSLSIREALRLSVRVPTRRALQVLEPGVLKRQGPRGRRLYRKTHAYRITAEGAFVLRGKTAVTCLPMRLDQFATFLVAEMTGVWV